MIGIMAREVVKRRWRRKKYLTFEDVLLFLFSLPFLPLDLIFWLFDGMAEAVVYRKKEKRDKNDRRTT